MARSGQQVGELAGPVLLLRPGLIPGTADSGWPTGGVYGEALETGWIYPGVAGGAAQAFAEAGQRLTRPDDWNSLRLLARGDRVQTWFNGEPRADYSHAPTNRPGRICLQVHGGEYDDPLAYAIRWRDLQIRPLD